MVIITKIQEMLPLPGWKYEFWNHIELDLYPDSATCELEQII